MSAKMACDHRTKKAHVSTTLNLRTQNRITRRRSWLADCRSLFQVYKDSVLNSDSSEHHTHFAAHSYIVWTIPLFGELPVQITFLDVPIHLLLLLLRTRLFHLVRQPRILRQPIYLRPFCRYLDDRHVQRHGSRVLWNISLLLPRVLRRPYFGVRVR